MTAETTWSDDMRKEMKHSAHDYLYVMVLFSGIPSGDRTLGFLRLSLRQKDGR